jgi:histidine triad (HIT) family protein
MAATDCVFCDIIAGRAEASIVCRDDAHVAFLDRRPLFEGHTLLVPTQHVVTLADLPKNDIAPFFTLTQRLSVAVPRAMDAAGSFVAMNNVVSQSVAHLHCHVVPRNFKDGLRGFFWPRTKYASDAEAASVATRILALTKPFEGS